jgi:hypothetical protein
LQAQAPKPDPELNRLLPWVGHWTIEGESKAGPLSPAGKFTGEQAVRMTLGGFFLETRVVEKTTTGETEELEIIGHDPVNKNFTLSLYEKGGDTYSGTFIVSANKVAWSVKSVVAEKHIQIRGTDVYAADWMSFTRKAEVSIDGKTWTPFYENNYTKVRPAAKK